MNDSHSRLEQNCDRIHERVAAACARVGRAPEAVRLVAVTKYAAMEHVSLLPELGVLDLGESRPQQLMERAAQLPAGVRWHLIGHLQRNKARKVLPLVSCVHSIDSLRLLATLDELAGEINVSPRVLLEVNVSGEAAKDGFAPDELLRSVDAIGACRHVRVEGLMTMAPLAEDAEAARPTFRGLRELRDRLKPLLPALMPLNELSMGMSGDFEVAIEEGATMVRIGSSLFEGLSL
jgi:PLP dependent protein